MVNRSVLFSLSGALPPKPRDFPEMSRVFNGMDERFAQRQ